MRELAWGLVETPVRPGSWRVARVEGGPVTGIRISLAAVGSPASALLCQRRSPSSPIPETTRAARYSLYVSFSLYAACYVICIACKRNAIARAKKGQGQILAHHYIRP